MTSDRLFSSIKLSQYKPLIDRLNNLYKNCEKRVSNKPIGLLLTSLLCIVFAGIWILDTSIKYGARDVISLFYTTVQQPSIHWYLPLLGFAGLDPDNVRDRIDVIIEYVRVSSKNQSDKSGKQRQKNKLNEEISNIDYEYKEEVSDDWESASTMLRKNIDEILENVRKYPDKTVALMLETTDRLSRAPPFEAATFLWILSNFDVIVYIGDQGYFDFSDPNQQMMAFFALYRSRQEFNKIKERTSSGQKQVKEAGGLPHQTPFGYSKVDQSTGNTKSHEVEINKQEAKVITKAVDRILEAEDPVVKTIWNDLQDKHEDDVENFPEYPACFPILRNEKYTGEVKHSGEVVGHIPQIISTEDYECVIEKIGKRESNANDELDHVLQSVIERFGIDGSIQLFDIIKGQCPECGGDIKTNGSVKRWGHRVLNYECIEADSESEEATEDECENDHKSNLDKGDGDDSKSTEDECDFSGPLLDESFLQKWDTGLPIVCPRCQTPADKEDWKQSNTRIDVVEQTCDECGLWYSADVSTDYNFLVERGMDFPDHAIRLFNDANSNGDSDEESDEENNDEESSDQESSDQDTTGAKDTEPDSSQEELDSFD